MPMFNLPKGVAPTVSIVIAGLTTGSNEQRENLYDRRHRGGPFGGDTLSGYSGVPNSTVDEERE